MQFLYSDRVGSGLWEDKEISTTDLTSTQKALKLTGDQRTRLEVESLDPNSANNIELTVSPRS